MCRHLLDTSAEDVDFVRLLTGCGIDFDLACLDCDKAVEAGGPVELIEVCEGCVAGYADERPEAWHGQPGILERHEPVAQNVIETPLPAGLGPVTDLVPAGVDDGSVWILLVESGEIVRFDAESGAHTTLATATVPDEPGHQPWAGRALRRRLHVSADARFAAVVNDYGQHGQVFDLESGQVTFTLHGGVYRPKTVPFSLAFARHDGRDVVVHRTAWNRLDVSDPATGELLTVREFPPAESSEQRPPHYLDFFHGGLLVSPDDRWLVNDGWVWHPVGITRAWELRRWLTQDVWESEDGPTVVSLCSREYNWNLPMTWINDDLLAVSGLGQDDDLIPGARILSVETGLELGAFAGPDGAFFSDGARLYSAGAAGMEVWDPFTGQRTGRVPGFVPTCHARRTGELAAVDGGILRRWCTSS